MLTAGAKDIMVGAYTGLFNSARYQELSFKISSRIAAVGLVRIHKRYDDTPTDGRSDFTVEVRRAGQLVSQCGALPLDKADTATEAVPPQRPHQISIMGEHDGLPSDWTDQGRSLWRHKAIAVYCGGAIGDRIVIVMPLGRSDLQLQFTEVEAFEQPILTSSGYTRISDGLQIWPTGDTVHVPLPSRNHEHRNGLRRATHHVGPPGARLVFHVAITANVSRYSDLGRVLRVAVSGGGARRGPPCLPASGHHGHMDQSMVTAVFDCQGAAGTGLDMLLSEGTGSAGLQSTALSITRIELLGDLSGDLDSIRQGKGYAAHRLSHLEDEVCGDGATATTADPTCYFTQPQMTSTQVNVRRYGAQRCGLYGGKVWYPRSSEHAAAHAQSEDSEIGVQHSTLTPYIGRDGVILS